MANNTISQIQIGGITYDICDATARNAIGSDTVSGLAKRIKTLEDILSRTLPTSIGGTGIAVNPSMLINLASTTAASVFAATPRPGVTGTLPVGHGGTGVTSNPSMLINLGTTAAASVFAAAPRPGVTGILPRGNGGTGKTARAQVNVTRDALNANNGSIIAYNNGVTGMLSAGNINLSSALATGSYRKIATIPDGYRPPMNVSACVVLPSKLNGGAWVRAAADGEVTLGNYSGSEFSTSLKLYFTITWSN